MNNYKITLYRTVKEACVWAVEADTPEAALALAREKIDYIDHDLWESYASDSEQRYGVELCK
jgi:hypothetical protein